MPMTNLLAHLHSLALVQPKFVEYPKQVLTHCPKKQETLESQTKLGVLLVPPHFID
jgi:hypothetical protein